MDNKLLYAIVLLLAVGYEVCGKNVPNRVEESNMNYETSSQNETHQEMKYEMHYTEMMTDAPYMESEEAGMEESATPEDEEEEYTGMEDEGYDVPPPEMPYDEPIIYQGMYQNECGADGLYYRDMYSFVVCTGGRAFIQPCAPGTINGDVNDYDGEGNNQVTTFCGLHDAPTDYARSYPSFYHQPYFYHLPPYFYQPSPYYHVPYKFRPVSKVYQQ